MAHPEQKVWCNYVKEKHPEMFKNVHVCDIGSLDINGNNRYLFENYKYVGVDICPGRNVDVISKGHEFKPSIQFDVVISSECFEHDEYWKETLNHIVNNLLKPGGMFIFTCATDGRHEHGTRRTSPADSPATQDYYMNINEDHVKTAINTYQTFSEYKFEVNNNTHDLYFYGIKK
jgi:SAM-dependent methyltransferase